jgi:hypothetical protein
MKTNRFFWTAMAVSCWAGCGAPATTTDEPALASESSSLDNDSSNPQLFGVDSHPYGISTKEWAFNWFRWIHSIPAATNPAIVAGVDYNQHQIGPVYFVPTGPNHNDAFTVPRHKAMAIMLTQVSNDYPCPGPASKPAPGQSVFDFLSTDLTKFNDSITVLDVALDGEPIVEPLKYRYTSSRLFYFVGDKSLAESFDTCVTGSLQPAVADDLFIIFKPLSRGQHVLVTHIVNADGVFDRTRTITAE